MSFSSSQKSRTTLTKLAFVLVVSIPVLTGCSTIEKMWGSSKEKSRDEKLAAIISGETEAEKPQKSQQRDETAKPDQADVAIDNVLQFKSDKESAGGSVLQLLDTISGGKSTSRLVDAVVGDRSITFQRPVAVCVRGDLMYVVDMDLMAVLRYQLKSGEIERVLDLNGVVTGDVADIYVSKDLSFYLTDTYGGRVLRYSLNGKLQQVFSNKLNLVYPVAVVEDAVTGAVLIADGQFDHVIVFNQQGDPYTTIGRRGNDAGESLNVTTMAVTRSDVYLASRVGGRIHVLSRDGDYLYSMQPEVIRFPLSLQVVSGKVFSSDYLDNTIKIFERGRLIETAGGTGVEPGKFKRITDLWYENGFLYAVDSLNGRIQRYKVAGEMPTVEPQAQIPQAPLEN